MAELQSCRLTAGTLPLAGFPRRPFSGCASTAPTRIWFSGRFR